MLDSRTADYAAAPADMAMADVLAGQQLALWIQAARGPTSLMAMIWPFAFLTLRSFRRKYLHSRHATVATLLAA